MSAPASTTVRVALFLPRNTALSQPAAQHIKRQLSGATRLRAAKPHFARLSALRSDDSEGNTYSGDAVKACRRRYREFRRGLQVCGKKGAKRRLLKISRKQSRFVRYTNHVISKKIVQTALQAGKALALEDLTGIRERANGYSAAMRWQMGGWAFFQLRTFVEYKAADAGIDVILIDPRNTSRTCSACGFCEKANRQSQARFERQSPDKSNSMFS